MRRRCTMLLAIFIVWALHCAAWAVSDQANQLRAKNDLSGFKPPEAFLGGNFVADEVDPAYIFGKVKDFVASRSCPTTWLIEKAEKVRIDARTPQSGPVEYTLTLEEDCPGKTAFYVFVDRSQANTAQWMEWRKQFHKSKAEPQYSTAKSSLEQAAQNGFSVDGELRFVEINGELQMKKLEDVLTKELKLQPVYDLKQAKAMVP